MTVARRVVVTGVGMVCPLGLGVPYVWNRLVAGDTATAFVADEWAKPIPCKVAARIPHGTAPHELNIKGEFSTSELRSLSPATIVSLIAAKEAITDAAWTPEDEKERQATGVAIGMGIVDLEDILATGKALEEKYSKVNPFFIPRILTNMAAGQISIKYGFQGPNHSVSTACATGTHSIGDCFRMIKYGDADVMVSGGSEAKVNAIGMAGFSRLRALSVKYNDNPSVASRPFDRDRDGFVMGEGSGIVVLEELEHARARDAKIYAEVLGFGMSGDAHHITSPREDGNGGERAMKMCMKEASVGPADVGYVNAHATSTPLGDEIELGAIGRVFGDNEVQVSSTKGAVGHLLGAAGAVESIFTILAVHAGFLPPTANLENPIQVPNKVNIVAKVGQPWIDRHKRRIALNNSFGFGGTNACLCFGSYE
ncbi:3-oxoacyl-[acyl-carrier-protein] synthase 2 [Trinorchestia longiramus]|nr:3-oxoacyl-[acyl-carrier-protein] synthase 2 [Trinorchestia longiramus]